MISDSPKAFLTWIDRKKEVDMLTDSQAGMLFKMLFRYADSKEEPQCDDTTVAVLFSVMKSQIDENNRKYAKTCERRSEGQRSRWKKSRENSDDTSEVKQSQKSQIESNEVKKVKLSQNDSNTDTDTVTDTDTKTDTDTNIYIYNTGENSPEPPSGDLDSEKPKKKSDSALIKEAIESYTENEELRQALKDFVEMRKKMKKPLTERAIKISLTNLDKACTTGTDDEKIGCVLQSVERCWQTFFPLKNYKKGGTDNAGSSNAEWDNRFGTLI